MNLRLNDVDMFALENKVRKVVQDLIEPTIRRTEKDSTSVAFMMGKFDKLTREMEEIQIIAEKANVQMENVNKINARFLEHERENRLSFANWEERTKDVEGKSENLEDYFNKRMQSVSTIEQAQRRMTNEISRYTQQILDNKLAIANQLSTFQTEINSLKKAVEDRAREHDTQLRIVRGVNEQIAETTTRFQTEMDLKLHTLTEVEESVSKIQDEKATLQDIIEEKEEISKQFMKINSEMRNQHQKVKLQLKKVEKNSFKQSETSAWAVIAISDTLHPLLDPHMLQKFAQFEKEKIASLKPHIKNKKLSKKLEELSSRANVVVNTVFPMPQDRVKMPQDRGTMHQDRVIEEEDTRVRRPQQGRRNALNLEQYAGESDGSNLDPSPPRYDPARGVVPLRQAVNKFTQMAPDDQEPVTRKRALTHGLRHSRSNSNNEEAKDAQHGGRLHRGMTIQHKPRRQSIKIKRTDSHVVIDPTEPLLGIPKPNRQSYRVRMNRTKSVTRNRSYDRNSTLPSISPVASPAPMFETIPVIEEPEITVTAEADETALYYYSNEGSIDDDYSEATGSFQDVEDYLTEQIQAIDERVTLNENEMEAKVKEFDEQFANLRVELASVVSNGGTETKSLFEQLQVEIAQLSNAQKRARSDIQIQHRNQTTELAKLAKRVSANTSFTQIYSEFWAVIINALTISITLHGAWNDVWNGTKKFYHRNSNYTGRELVQIADHLVNDVWKKALTQSDTEKKQPNRSKSTEPRVALDHKLIPEQAIVEANKM